MLTDEQKSLVLRLRRDGLRYSDIAKQTGISASTIRSLCDRDQCITEMSAEPLAPDKSSTGLCKQCGNDLHVTAINRMKRFCSEACRQKWWREHNGTITRDAATAVCAECGKVFKTGGRASRKYCSSGCYIQHRFQNQMEGKNA